MNWHKSSLSGVGILGKRGGSGLPFLAVSGRNGPFPIWVFRWVVILDLPRLRAGVTEILIQIGTLEDRIPIYGGQDYSNQVHAFQSPYLKSLSFREGG